MSGRLGISEHDERRLPPPTTVEQKMRAAAEKGNPWAMAILADVENEALRQQLRGAVSTLERVYDLLSDPDGADVLKALSEVEAALPDYHTPTEGSRR